MLHWSEDCCIGVVVGCCGTVVKIVALVLGSTTLCEVSYPVVFAWHGFVLEKPSRQVDDATTCPRRAMPSHVLSFFDGMVRWRSRRRKWTRPRAWPVFVPNHSAYRQWWAVTVVASVVSGFVVPNEIAFSKDVGFAPYDDAGAVVQYILEAIFAVDMAVQFNLAFYRGNHLVMERKEIAKKYGRGMFWVDLLALFPIDVVVLASAGVLKQQTALASYLALIRLLRMLRLYRLSQMVLRLQYNHKVSLLLVTLFRNFLYVMLFCNFSAAGFYFIARRQGFTVDTWVQQGPVPFDSMNLAQRYIASIYWAMSTFQTIGFGDYFPTNTAEQVWVALFMFLGILLMAYVQTSFLLLVKTDNRAMKLRESSRNVKRFCSIHQLDPQLKLTMLDHLRLRFDAEEVSDENVLGGFPGLLRLQVLRRLYLPCLERASLLQGASKRFLDLAVANSNVEFYLPGMDVIEPGSTVGQLYILVAGVVELHAEPKNTIGSSLKSMESSSVGANKLLCEPGDLIGDIQFILGGKVTSRAHTLTVCKMLILPREKYRKIAELHPASARKVLSNLLDKLAAVRSDVDASLKNDVSGEGRADSTLQDVKRLKGLIESNLASYTQNETTALRFAAARGDAATVRTIIKEGIDVNIPNDEGRTALMLAAVEGDQRVVSLLLDTPGIDVNQQDSFGRTALREAVENKHTDIAEQLLRVGASLGFIEDESAKRLCIAVSQGDHKLLAVLLLAGAPAAAQDFLGRTALHIAAMQGDVAATALLLRHGAKPDLMDTWGRTAFDEAITSGATRVQQLLEGKADLDEVS